MEKVPTEEIPILDALVAIRHRLSAMKRDRDSYIRTSDVLSVYDAVLAQVQRLYDVRHSCLSSETTEEKLSKKNRTDDVLDDVIQLLSLFFMAVGKNRESPATYVQLVTIKQFLGYVKERARYTKEDLEPYRKRLQELDSIIKADEKKEETPELFIKLIRSRYAQCDKLLSELEQSLDSISPELLPLRTRLIDLRRHLALFAVRGDCTADDIKPIQAKLREIDSSRVDGKFLGPDGSVPAGQAVVVGLLEECFEESHNLLAFQGDLDYSLRPVGERLMDIKTQLDRLLLTHRWTLRETDLWTYQQQLAEINSMRKDGKFLDSSGQPARGQALLNYLLSKCYHLIHRLLSSSEPVAEPLVPIHNQLLTVRGCLLEVKKWGGPFTARELYPYQMKLASIDNMRTDGKFLDPDGNVPEGQAICMALLNECYDTLYELRSNVVEEE
ncbi:uncharacterized protein VTP21DRAFT_7270 [Calcarisporiella thermophila]|uniref:uncharacterized protein n=1 Tax=Calcarisporiella thermophila TaxID=911321 RepID=UPI0037437E10